MVKGIVSYVYMHDHTYPATGCTVYQQSVFTCASYVRIRPKLKYILSCLGCGYIKILKSNAVLELFIITLYPTYESKVILLYMSFTVLCREIIYLHIYQV